MEFKKILSQTDITSFISSVSWEHASFRELYVISPSFIYPDNSKQAYPDFYPNMGMLILCFGSEIPAVELMLLEVERIQISFASHLKPELSVLNDTVELRFNSSSLVRAKTISFRFPKKEEILGDKIRYGKYWDELFA
jgi:hypothetical protein